MQGDGGISIRNQLRIRILWRYAETAYPQRMRRPLHIRNTVTNQRHSGFELYSYP